MPPKYYKVIFKSFQDGYYTFRFDDSLELIFEEIHPRILLKYDLKHDTSLLNKSFHLSFSEYITDDEEDWVIYKIDYLELINNN